MTLLRRKPALRFSCLSFVALFLALALSCAAGAEPSPADLQPGTEKPVDSLIAFSRFDSGDEGWRIIDIPDNGPYDKCLRPTKPTHNAGAGSPAGCISSTDPGADNFYWDAPSAYLGDKLDAYGGALSFDMKSEGGNYFDMGDIVLIGAGLVLVYDIPNNPGPNWATFSVPMIEGGWKNGSPNGPPVSVAEFRKALSQLTALRIRGEYRWGAETCYLDNVRLVKGPEQTASPTPPTEPTPEDIEVTGADASVPGPEREAINEAIGRMFAAFKGKDPDAAAECIIPEARDQYRAAFVKIKSHLPDVGEMLRRATVKSMVTVYDPWMKREVKIAELAVPMGNALLPVQMIKEGDSWLFSRF